MTCCWCWWSFYLSHVIILYEVVSHFILYYSIIHVFFKWLNTIEHRHLHTVGCADASMLPNRFRRRPLDKVQLNESPVRTEPAERDLPEVGVFFFLAICCCFFEPFDVWIFFKSLGGVANLAPWHLGALCGHRGTSLLEIWSRCQTATLVAAFLVGKMYALTMGFDVTTRWRELGTSWPNVSDGGALLMDTFSPCVLVFLRTLGVAWLSRKVPAKNDPSIVMNIHGMKVSPWKCNGRSTYSCVIIISDSFWFLPRDSKRLLFLLTKRQFRTAKLARKFAEKIGRRRRHFFWADTGGGGTPNCCIVVEPCRCPAGAGRGRHGRKNFTLPWHQRVLWWQSAYEKPHWGANVVIYGYMFTVIPFLSHINVRILFGLNIF